MILTIDFGTSVTKVALWGEDGMTICARAELQTRHPEIGWSEQEPFGWWTSVVVACAQARAAAPAAFVAVELIACSAARQTFVPVRAGADPIGRGLLWSDRRAVAEAHALAERLGGPEAVRQRTGVPLDGGAVAAKIAWLADHEPGRLGEAAWLLSPRDLILWRLTGQVMTDPTLASRTGLYDLSGEPIDELVGAAAGKLAPVVPSDAVGGELRAVPAAELGLRPGTRVVPGAGDRACEVLGAGASSGAPLVSWGTTANVSLPVAARPDPIPPGPVLSPGADGGWLLEGGLSAAGSFLDWLARLSGRPSGELAELAAKSPPGARGVLAVPWLDGARAPWWRDDARAAFVGLASAHDVGDLTRAVFESVAWEIVRCLRAMTVSDPNRRPPRAISLAGAGARVTEWVDVLTAVAGLPASRRRSGEAASAGAALLASHAESAPIDLDDLDPVEWEVEPDPTAVAAYAGLAERADELAVRLLDLS